MSLLVLLACSAAPDDTAPVAVEEEPPPAALLTADEALAAVETGTQHGLPDTLDLLDTYAALMALGDAQCPGPGDQLIDTQVPLSGCTSDSGVTYAGVSMLLDEADLGGGDPSYVARLIGGDFTITDAQGDTLDFGGQMVWSGRTGDGGRLSVMAQASGTFVYPAGSPWLAAGVSTVLDMQLEVRADEAPRLVLNGGIGTEGVDLWLDALVFGEGCADGGPTGAVRVRDPSGAWWTIDFADRCDGCATLSYPGLADAEVCPDLGPFYEGAVAMLETSP